MTEIRKNSYWGGYDIIRPDGSTAGRAPQGSILSENRYWGGIDARRADGTFVGYYDVPTDAVRSSLDSSPFSPSPGFGPAPSLEPGDLRH